MLHGAKVHGETLNRKSLVTEVAPATARQAETHFASLLGLETDCSDVHASMQSGEADFVLLDVRGPVCFAAGHVEGAVSFPHATLTEAALAEYPSETIFVVYCAGPHCNGADKAALRLARLGRMVKKMIGGISGWQHEGLPLVATEAARDSAGAVG